MLRGKGWKSDGLKVRRWNYEVRLRGLDNRQESLSTREGGFFNSRRGLQSVVLCVTWVRISLYPFFCVFRVFRGSYRICVFQSCEARSINSSNPAAFILFILSKDSSNFNVATPIWSFSLPSSDRKTQKGLTLSCLLRAFSRRFPLKVFTPVSECSQNTLLAMTATTFARQQIIDNLSTSSKCIF